MKPPSISRTAFACPHCGVFTSQRWLRVWGNEYNKDGHPVIPSADSAAKVGADRKISEEKRAELLALIEKMRSRLVFIEHSAWGTTSNSHLHNLNASECFACSELAIWVADRLVFPANAIGPNPNSDLPKEIADTFQEARRIANESPRGAAALLRLCVQMLCVHLGEKGKKIDDDIKSLVAKGLNPTVQKSLDIVRVIGNEAVHPGTIDIKDDRETATALFELVNAIADQMISHPKKVDALYAKLPAKSREAIVKRDAPKV